jgi:hypothetical protein
MKPPAKIFIPRVAAILILLLNFVNSFYHHTSAKVFLGEIPPPASPERAGSRWREGLNLLSEGGGSTSRNPIEKGDLLNAPPPFYKGGSEGGISHP